MARTDTFENERDGAYAFEHTLGWLFAVLALIGIFVLWKVGVWYSGHLRERAQRKAPASLFPALPRHRIAGQCGKVFA